MSTSTVNSTATVRKHRPYVPETMEMKEFTLRALLIGLVMTAILGSANAYLGLKAGMTIAATYPAAVIGMAVLRLMKGSLLEENIARTVGSIGESVAAGAVFTIPAFLISGAWGSFGLHEAYWKSVALMAVGGSLGILFVTLLRRVMVEDPELPFPESVAASQIHKAGQQGSQAAKLLFYNMGFGGLVYLLGAFQLFNASKAFVIHVGKLGAGMLRLGRTATSPTVAVGGITTFPLRSCSVRFVAARTAADFFKSEMARFMPSIRLRRIRNRVHPAPTSMPPTAIGRTMLYQTVPARFASAPGARFACNLGPRK